MTSFTAGYEPTYVWPAWLATGERACSHRGYGGGLKYRGSKFFSTAPRVSRISAPKMARAATANELRACDTGCAHLIRTVAA